MLNITTTGPFAHPRDTAQQYICISFQLFLFYFVILKMSFMFFGGISGKHTTCTSFRPLKTLIKYVNMCTYLRTHTYVLDKQFK